MDTPFYIQQELYTDILQEYGNLGYEEKERHTCYLPRQVWQISGKDDPYFQQIVQSLKSA